MVELFLPAYLPKETVGQAWSRCDWSAYHTHVLAAKRVQAIALHHY